MAKAAKRPTLGRGLDSLIRETVSFDDDDRTSSEGGESPLTLPIEHLSPNPEQPRRRFGEEELASLADSISKKGILQPILVRPDPNVDGRYQIVAGERRWRAAQRARLHEVPVIVRSLDDLETLEIAIIENVQREDLSPVEEARGYRRLIDQFGHTQDRLARLYRCESGPQPIGHQGVERGSYLGIRERVSGLSKSYIREVAHGFRVLGLNCGCHVAFGERQRAA